jgi:hypothetical protein
MDVHGKTASKMAYFKKQPRPWQNLENKDIVMV